ncbi:MAG: MBL fold metallo-hydrolase, partial [Ilumatobacteraceae bacterium]
MPPAQTPPTEAVRPGLWSIGVPIPDNPLGYTLVYLIESDRGPVLVDAGWDDDESWDALVAGFRAAGTDVSECYGVLVTHVHPDHHGLSGRVREASDAWVAMHERDAVTVEHLSSAMAQESGRQGAQSQTSPDFTDELMAVLLDAGASETELAAAPAPSGRRRTRRFRPLAVPDRTIDDGARVDV